MLRFDDRVAVITGSTHGMGRAYAELIGSRGGKVVINCRKENDAAHQVVDTIKAAGGDAVIVAGDVSKEETITNMVKAAVDNWGRVDIAISNAAGPIDTALPSGDVAHTIDHGFNVHVRSTLLLNSLCWPYMEKQGYGRLLVTGSAGGTGYIALPGGYYVDYSLCKSSMFGLVRQTAAHGKKFNITCNMIMPWAYSKMVDEAIGGTELGLWMEANQKPSQVAAAVAPLLHEKCPVTGEAITAGGGRVGRIFFASTLGIFDRDITPEEALDRWDEIMGTTGPDGTLLGVFETTQPREEAVMGSTLMNGKLPALEEVAQMPLKGGSMSMDE